MSYTPINWQTGDVITAEKLNRCDNGWGVESTQLFSETVTTSQFPFGGKAVGNLEYSGTEFPDSLSITFDDTEYECQFTDGDYDVSGVFSLIPTAIEGEGWSLYTPAAGTYSISATGNLMQVSPNFSDAVDKASTVDATMLPLLCVDGETTYDEMNSACESQRLLYFY